MVYAYVKNESCKSIEAELPDALIGREETPVAEHGDYNAWEYNEAETQHLIHTGRPYQRKAARAVAELLDWEVGPWYALTWEGKLPRKAPDGPWTDLDEARESLHDWYWECNQWSNEDHGVSFETLFRNVLLVGYTSRRAAQNADISDVADRTNQTTGYASINAAIDLSRPIFN